MGILPNPTYKKRRVLETVLTTIFGLSAFFFWLFPYKSALSYHEQFQLFLTTSTYFKEALSIPGGLARYCGEFLVQMYVMPVFGALVLSLILIVVQILVYAIAKKIRKDMPIWGYLLSFIPSLLIWLYIGDENVLLPFCIASVSLLLAVFYYTSIERPYHRLATAVVIVLCGYWFMGTIVYAFVLYATIYEAVRKSGTMHLVVTGVTLCLTIVAAIIIVSNIVNYPIERLFNDLVYYRIPTTVPLMQYIIMGMLAVVPFACSSNKAGNIIKSKYENAVALSILLLYGAMMAGGVGLFYDEKKYELMDYDCMVRTNNWQGIIRKASEKRPDLPMSVCATNLALGMTGQLCESAFNYYQNGAEGLLPPFQRNSNSMLITAEAYFLLGLTNTAQRFYFEAMEGIPNYAHSGRCLKRLAETNLLNGQYAVAEKYLKILENTLFYKEWARQTSALMKEEGAIDKHPLYGNLRRSHLTNDYLFSESEIDKILGQLFIKNKENQLAMQYMLLCSLLQRDVNKFMQYLSVVQQYKQYKPTICQQGIAFAYMQANKQIPQNMVSPAIIERLKNFATIVTADGKQSPRLAAHNNTLWYYLIVGSKSQN